MGYILSYCACFIMLYRVVLTFEYVDENLSGIIQMIAI